MATLLQDIVKFRGDRLFHGAVNVDWFNTDMQKRRAAAESFVFHGPEYHGVSQADVGSAHGHNLQDTASFTRSIVQRCYGVDDQPFTLAIAGYGTGKSHLALTLAALLSDPEGDVAETVLSNLEAVDAGIGSEVRAVLKEHDQPCLVVAINGMGNFDLTAEIMRQTIEQVRSYGLDTKPLDDLRPRFMQAVSLIRMSSDSVIKELLDACELSSVDNVLEALEKQDEGLYQRVHEFFSSHGMPIRALGGESVRDLIDVVSIEYCGIEKPFGRLLILFDEFGRYTEFATVRSQIAGSGVLQDLFEAVQANTDTACLVGFIQFELNAYVQRVTPEYKNEILRYITRYQSASKVYLSVNIETLIAHLLEKHDSDKLDAWFNDNRAHEESEKIAENLYAWFPQTLNHRLWKDPEQFHKVIRKGCWPLSPYSTWFLFYLTAAGKHLQERSALSLLGEVFQRTKNTSITDDGTWLLSPVDLWTDELHQELISSEESGQQGSITHAYSTVYARHGSKLSEHHARILRGVVLASKIGLHVNERDEAVEALTKLSGLPLRVVSDSVHQLQYEYNVLEWDESFKAFDILGDAVPRTQFLSFVRQRVASSFDEEGKAKLFAGKAADYCDLLRDLDCDFAEKHSITTREWRYQGVTSNLNLLETHIKFAVDRWVKAVAVDEARGAVVYCYTEQSRDPKTVMDDTKKLIRKIARENGYKELPILIVLLCDEEGILGQALAELSVLEDSITEEDRARFGNLIGAHQEKMYQIIRNQVESMIKQRRYIVSLKDEMQSRRLGRAGTELFERIYTKPLSFPFDGFSTARGNAADTCQQLTSELLHGSLDYDSVIAKPVKVKNRAVTVLKDCWGVFTNTGAISRRPAHPVLRRITEKWDGILQSDQQRFFIGEELQQLFLPPHGANVASAGMVLGLFVAPRSNKLVVVLNGQQYALSQWLQDGVFKGKFLDLNALQNIELLPIGETSSEWEVLLDEWEQLESHYDRKECLKRANKLKDRIPLPPALLYRSMHLEKQGLEAIEKIDKMDKEQSDALKKLEKGFDRENISMLSWGTVKLIETTERMAAESPLWTISQIEQFQPLIERTRQAIIQILPEWLSRQAPRGDNPTAVGEFKHMMLRIIGGNLKRLGLDEQYDELEKRTNLLVRDVETAAEARQLVRDVRSWLEQHTDAFRIVRVAEIRGLRNVGKEFSNKSQGMSRRIEMTQLSEVRTKLANFLKSLKEAEADVMKRASRLWNAKLRSIEDIEMLYSEVSSLFVAFEGCEKDLEDLDTMKRVLQTYKRDYQKLQDENLTWQEFLNLSEKFRQEAKAIFDEDEMPWSVDETFSKLEEIISKQRKQASKIWIEAMESEAESIETMTAADANRLHAKVRNPPAFLTEQHIKSLTKILSHIVARLDSLEVDWLVERFKALPETLKKRFLQIADKLLQIS